MSSISYSPKKYLLSKFLGMSKQDPKDEVWEVIVGEYSDSGGMGDLTKIMTYSHYLEITKGQKTN